MAENTTSRLQRIQELKEQLYNTQGEVIKTMEGYPVDDPDIFAKRQFWREQITTLEGMTDAEYESYVEPEVTEYVKDVPTADDIVSQLKELVSTQVSELSDEEAKKVPALFPLWKDLIGKTATLNQRVYFNASLYKCLQPHEVQATWTPDVSPSLWQNVSEEAQEADGSHDNPFTWEVGMTCYNGKYYIEDGILYLCTRDSGGPVYNRIADLPTGLYFEPAE